MFSATIFCLLLSGSLFSAAFFKKHFEEVLPITCMSISAILFIFGMLGILKAGFWFVLITLLTLTAISIPYIFIRKRFGAFSKSFFTPAFFVFAILFLVICICNKGKLAIHNDEFSHWVDSVKAMFLLDDFATNENSHSLFKSYPPAMTLFQYFFQRVNCTLLNNNAFVEEKVYVAYQVFCLSMILPFFKKLNSRKVLSFFISCIAIVCAPLLFYPDILSVVVVDPFISVLAGCAFSSLLLNNKLDKIQCIYLTMICFTLVLAKDIGLYFSCFICVCYIIRLLSKLDLKDMPKNKYIKSISVCFLPIFATAAAKILWKVELSATKVSVSGGKTGLLAYTKMFFLKEDQSYKQNVVEKFKSALFENRITLGDLSFSVSYFLLTVVAFLMLFLLCTLYIRKTKNKREIIAFRLISLVIGIQLILFIYSLGAIYIANFSEYEAQNLASYQRYMDIVFRTVYITIVICLTCYFNSMSNNRVAFAVFVSMVIILTPFSKVEKFVNREHVSESVSVRNKYSEMTNDVNVNCPEKSKLYFISQEDKGYDYYLMKFALRPHLIDNYFAWSLSENGPLYDGDIWTKKMSAAEFQEILFTQDYDYVAIYKTNDSFKIDYASLFENPDDIENNSVFRFDRGKRILERVDK